MSEFDLQKLQQIGGVGTLTYRDSMTSTSDIAREMLSQNPDSHMPLLVLCDHQTAGRGQPGKTWHSDSDSLTFTWCVEDLSIPLSNQPLLPLIAGVCVCEAIKSVGIEGAKLKWPNDVLIERKKVCGILVEKISTGSRTWFLVGIGINVNQTDVAMLQSGQRSHFPPSSLQMRGGRLVEAQRLLLEIVKGLLESTKAKMDWAKKCMPFLDFVGATVGFEKADGEVVKGVFRGIDETGKIAIDVEEGRTQLFASGHLCPSGEK